MSFEKNTPKKSLNIVCKLSILLNILTLCFGVGYMIIPVHTFILDFFGLILILSWMLNIIIIYLDDLYLKKTSVIGKRINHLSFYYIIIFIIALLVMVFNLLFINLIVEEEILLFIANLWILFGFSLISGVGILLGIETLLNLEKRGVWDFE